MGRTISPSALDGYSERIIPIYEGMWEYGKESSNGCYISEASLTEMVFYLSNVTFSILSPILLDESISNNVKRLASFRELVNGARIPHYHIVGKWYGEDNDTHTIDKGYILIKPDHMTNERFFDFMRQAIRNYDQEAFVTNSPGEDLLCVDREGKVVQAYNGNLSVNLLAKAYAFRLSIKKNFSFIGTEISNGSIGSFRLMKGSKLEYYLPKDFFNRKKIKPGEKIG